MEAEICVRKSMRPVFPPIWEQMALAFAGYQKKMLLAFGAGV